MATDDLLRLEASAPADDQSEAVLRLARELEARSDDAALALHELGSLLVTEESVDTTLQRIADLAGRVIDDCDAAGVTLVVDGKYVTAAYTARRTLAVDQGQYERGDGPCLQAMRDKKVLRCTLEAAEARWPDFVADARQHGVRSFLAAPLLVRDEGIGALNLYSEKPHGFDRLDDALIALFASQASIALMNAKVYDDALRLTAQLQEALESRAVIEQAKGVLMATEGLDADEAFGRLREMSQHRNMKLRTIAVEVVQRTCAAP